MTGLFDGRSFTAPVTDAVERRIVEAAAVCFIRDGVGKTTMVGIARQAGVGVATVYRRFGQKENLVQVTLVMEIHRFLDTLTDRLAATDGTPEEQLAEGFAAFVATVVDRPLLVDALENDDAADLLPMMTAGGNPFLTIGTAYAESLVRRALSAYGSGEEYDPRLIAEILARLAHSLALTPQGNIPVDDAAARTFARTYLLPLLHPAGAAVAATR